jgi:hypothetical protein
MVGWSIRARDVRRNDKRYAARGDNLAAGSNVCCDGNLSCRRGGDSLQPPVLAEDRDRARRADGRIGSDGSSSAFTARREERLANVTGARRALLSHSGTGAPGRGPRRSSRSTTAVACEMDSLL